MHNYRELDVWKKARMLVKDIYVLTKTFPEDERFGLISQMRRCAVSIPSNIAEGSGRSTDKDFANFLSISLGSSYELETQVWLSHDLLFINETQREEVINLITDTQKMIFNLRRRFK